MRITAAAPADAVAGSSPSHSSIRATCLTYSVRMFLVRSSSSKQ